MELVQRSVACNAAGEEATARWNDAATVIAAERSMKKNGCQYCMCPEVEPCRFKAGELLLLLTLRRPAVCVHCTQRQYVIPFILQRLMRLFFRTPQRALKYRR
jgi:hypothetical protein